MKGYSKINGNNSFIQRSKSNKEFVFLDRDFDLLSSKSTTKKTHVVHEQESSIPDLVNNNRKVGFFIEKTEVIPSFEPDRKEGYDGGDHHSLKQENGEKTVGAVRRNFSISCTKSSYQKNNDINKGNNNISLERQSSTRAIQEAVKRAFSIRRSSSVNSDKYCRIYDQPNMTFDDYVNYDDDDDVNGTHNHHDDDFEGNGSLDTRYVHMKNNTNHHNHGRKHVGSKVVRACKRLFSR